MKQFLILLVFFSITLSISAQEDAWVYFIDKEDVANKTANPTSILTQKAIDRKMAHGVVIDARDVPVTETYITQIKGATGITVMAKSKWFNAVHVRGSETDINNLASNFSFIDHIEFANRSLNISKTVKQKQNSKFAKTLTTFNYGNAANQIQMIKGEQLHLSNYTGTGMTIAVLDAGFPNVNTMSSFQYLRNANNILGTYDFVGNDTDVYTNTTSDHGTLVLSTMAGYVENQYVGTAPDASYYLFITEEDNFENPVEESYWVEAAERADSLGVDVINSSLAYSNYDNSNYSYAASDMNGTTAFISRGANIAFEKGILIVNSAGNSGNAGVSAPADAAGVFTIGAVNSSGNYASFSSVGTTFQPAQKPDVVAQGQGSAVISVSDVLSTSNGTSFSSPILAGAITCLWQALPNKTNAEIMQLVRESASQFSTPDNLLGYGIPDFQLALNNTLSIDYNELSSISIYPNPTKDIIYFQISRPERSLSVIVFDVTGKQVVDKQISISDNIINMSSLSKGMYIVNLKSAKTSKTIKVVKQ